MSTWSSPIRFSEASSDDSRYLREPHSPYGPGCISYPALVEMISSSRYGAKSWRKSLPKLSSAEPGGGP